MISGKGLAQSFYEILEKLCSESYLGFDVFVNQALSIVKTNMKSINVPEI